MEKQKGGKGSRYSDENKINFSKVLAVIIAIVVVIIFILTIKYLLAMDVNEKKGNEFFALYSKDKWGVIDNIGNVVITASYAEMITIPDSVEDIFICTYDINEQTGEYKTKVLNKQNKEIFTEYEQVEALENFDKAQNVWYEKNVLRVKKDGKYGLINFKGEQILECEYDNIYTLKGIENSIIVNKNGKLGLVDDSGRKIINTEYNEILGLGSKDDEGYITINSEGKYGVISYTKQQLLKNEYEYIEQIYGKNLYVIKENGKQKLIDSSGNKLLEDGYDEIKAILAKSNQGIIYKKNNNYGILQKDGTVLIEAQYEDLKELENGLLSAKKNGKYGIIDIQNNEKLPFSYLSISYNKEAEIYIAEEENNQTSIIDKDFNVKLIGILSELNSQNKYIRMRIGTEYQYYDFGFNEKTNIEVLKANTLFLKQENGKYGYVNSKGETVVDYIYDDATEQNRFGFSAVKKNGLWGAIDSKGNEIVRPKYQLTNNIIIDFIGKWHLGEDLNMKYYCEK